ncbi:MAG TPA: D-alanyl-D-alanine carboxypeptidase/D-alanyl-D-alanine-endopeptidase [Candidatus Angelobacter sp.]|nr:D-alanyl-D-alanine carboxypeptidase/D-alanyl-D-alanine-endopeptidase [Candidatus Angelobacter sp.]
MAALLLVLCLSSALTAESAAAKKAPSKKNLAEQIKAILGHPPLSRAHWGLDVVDLESGKTVYALNADQLFIPASNTKLFTTAAALATAKPDYRFHTTIESSSTIDANGRLLGDLVIVGRGDPNISGRVVPFVLKTERVPPHTQVLEELVDQLVARGLKIVDGDVIGDDTFYSPERYGEGWAHDDLQWIDGAPVTALTFNDNVVFVNIQPGEHDGDKALVTPEPENSYYDIENRIVTTAAGIVRKIGIHRDPGSKKVLMWGNIPIGDPGVKEALAIEDPAEFTAQLFRSLLERRGITVTGKTRARHGEIAQFYDQPPSSLTPRPGNQRQGCCMTATEQATQPATPMASPTPAPNEILAEHVSLPFLEDVRIINKTSQNLHAELALRLTGKLAGQGGSFEGGAAAVKQFLLQAGITDEDFIFLDGSGLSRRNLVTPAAVVRLLAYAARQPWGAAYEDSLPVSGTDGSLQDRLGKSGASGLVHAKTGTLSHVNALSGYAQTIGGRRLVFSIFCNNHNLPGSKTLAAIDEIVELLVKEGGAAR